MWASFGGASVCTGETRQSCLVVQSHSKDGFSQEGPYHTRKPKPSWKSTPGLPFWLFRWARLGWKGDCPIEAVIQHQDSHFWAWHALREGVLLLPFMPFQTNPLHNGAGVAQEQQLWPKRIYALCRFCIFIWLACHCRDGIHKGSKGMDTLKYRIIS